MTEVSANSQKMLLAATIGGLTLIAAARDSSRRGDGVDRVLVFD
jgi:hypothetical protein